MRTTFSRRLLLPLLGLAASTALVAGCGSDSNGNGTFNGPTGNNNSVSSVSTPTASAPSTIVDSSSPAESTSPLPTTGGGDDAAFCSVIKNGYQKIVQAGTDQQAAAKVFEDAAQVAPAQIKSDAEYVANALRNPAGADISRVTDATKNVLTYYATKCATS